MPSSGIHRLAAIVLLPPGTGAAVLEPLAGQAPLTRVVRQLLDGVADPAAVVVVAAEHHADDVGDLLVREGLAAVGVAVVDAPATRAQCLSAGLEEVVREPVSARSVLVHDVGQPLISDAVRNRVIERLTDGAAAVLPVQPVTDSVKAVDEHGAVTATLDRSTLRSVQYPRGFAADHLAGLLARSAGEFDEALEAIRSAVPVTTVDGDADGFSAELPHDAAFLEAVIVSRRSG